MSQSQVNQVLRVLEKKPRKYTVQIHKPDGSKVEFQSDSIPSVSFDNETRREWLNCTMADYTTWKILEWERGMILLVETNPESLVSPS